MSKKIFSKVLFISVLFLAMIACGVATPAPTPNVLETVVALTLTSVPVAPVTVAPTPVPVTFTAIASPESFAPEEVGTRYVYTSAQNVNLRVNPGRLFKVSRVLAQGTRLQLLGYAPGKLWLNVVNDEGVVGWVGVDFVRGGFDGPPPPVIDPQKNSPKDVMLVVGTVKDVNGNPVSGIGFAMVQNGQRDDTATDETGTFYAFLPTKLAGQWNVGFVSVACMSEAADDKCRCVGPTCGRPNPESISVRMPISAPLSFVWK